MSDKSEIKNGGCFQTMVDAMQIVAAVSGIVALLVGTITFWYSLTNPNRIEAIIGVLPGFTTTPLPPNNTPYPTYTPYPTPRAIAQPTNDNSATPTELSQMRSEVAQLRSDLDSMNSRILSMEEAILENPAKALELTLLKRDMEDLKKSYQDSLESTAIQIDRIYDFNKWLIGLMLPMAVGVVALVVNNFLPGSSEKSKEKPSDE